MGLDASNIHANLFTAIVAALGAPASASTVAHSFRHQGHATAAQPGHPLWLINP